MITLLVMACVLLIVIGIHTEDEDLVGWGVAVPIGMLLCWFVVSILETPKDKYPDTETSYTENIDTREFCIIAKIDGRTKTNFCGNKDDADNVERLKQLKAKLDQTEKVHFGDKVFQGMEIEREKIKAVAEKLDIEVIDTEDYGW